MTDMFKKAVVWIIGAAGLAILAMAIQYWIQLNVESQLASAGIIPQSDFNALQESVADLEKLHDKDTERVERKAEDIARILMED